MGDNAKMLLEEANVEITSMPHFVVISLADDWEGLYVNNILVREAHRIRTYDILEVAEELEILTFNQFEDWTIMDEDESYAPNEVPEKYRK